MPYDHNKSLISKTIEQRTWTEKNGIEHQAIDYYSNSGCKWLACRKAIGSNHKEDVEQWLDSDNLIVVNGGTNGRWYVCWID